MKRRRSQLSRVFALVAVMAFSSISVKAHAAPLFYGPSAYLCFDRTNTSTLTPTFVGSCGTSDSPFAAASLSGGFSYFYLETFEDHLFNTPGVFASAGGVTSVVFGPSIHDSVDADDRSIDGSGLLGDSYFSGSGATGVTFTFNGLTLGALPTHVGIVWTDGAGTTRFEAFGPGGVSLGVIGPVSIADGSHNGETPEDRFFGVFDLGGIQSIHISNSGGGIEVDHLQYGQSAPPTQVPEPGSLSLISAGLAGLMLLRRRR